MFLLNELLVIINKNKLMQHFHIIATILIPLPQDPRGEQSTRETSRQVDEALGTKQQILEYALLSHFVKRRKVKRKLLKKF